MMTVCLTPLDAILISAYILILVWGVQVYHEVRQDWLLDRPDYPVDPPIANVKKDPQ